MLNQTLARVVSNPLVRAYVLAGVRLMLTATAAWLASHGYIMADQTEQFVGLGLGAIAAAAGVSDVSNVNAKINAALQLPHDAPAAEVDKVKQS